MSSNPPIFTINIRIDRQIIKLQVHEEDSISDLIEQLFKKITWKPVTKDKLKTRLEQQFKKVLTKEGLSQNLKFKLN